ELRIRPEAHRRTGVALANAAHHLQLRRHFAVVEADLVFLTPALDQTLELLRKRVDHRDAYAMEPAGEFVSLIRELSARVQARKDQLDAADLLFRVNVHG